MRKVKLGLTLRRLSWQLSPVQQTVRITSYKDFLSGEKIEIIPLPRIFFACIIRIDVFLIKETSYEVRKIPAFYLSVGR